MLNIYIFIVMEENKEALPTGYNLSRQFFDWCFENPDKVKPNHIALYFFIVEHCNRMGWKRKFGLPTTMAKEAIGIRSYHTYINTLNDLIEFGFIILIEKSKNQYSSNIIALANFDKAHSKASANALANFVKAHDKASAKQVHCSGKFYQSTCQSTCQSIDSINKHITIEPLTNNKADLEVGESNNKKIDWRNSFDVYKSELKEAYIKIINDVDYIKQRKTFHQRLNIEKTIEKACVDFWATEEGWAHKKKSKSEKIDWKKTFSNSISQKVNWVYMD